ncbi:MAG: DNA-3-methyladenine glycosylase I [Thermodesulfobacteriota bacterium]|nr:DNA-3-methyladenine glycosylase I [Thermodesulfobacteriota bacterium]
MNSEIQFEIGGRYKNRNGWYEVIEINGDRLHIRCEKDGIEANLGMEMQKRIMANMTLEEKQESPPLVQNKINISNESFKELYKRVCANLKDSGFDMEDVVYPFPDFKKIDDKSIFEGLCKAIFTAQAKWKSYEKNLDRIDLLLFNYDFNKIKNITDEEIEKIYEEMIEMKVRDRFLLRKLNDFRKNARVFFNFSEQGSSVYEFLKWELSDKEMLIKKLTNNGSSYKLIGVGLPICCEFFKNIGVDDFKPDVHMVYLFSRLGIAEIKNPKAPTVRELYSIRATGMDIAKSNNEPFHVVDNVLWFFCAEGKAEICTTNNPKCFKCKLRNEEPVMCGGNFIHNHKTCK